MNPTNWGETRTTCRSCASEALTGFLDLGQMPLSDALRNADEVHFPEPRYPLDVAFCGACSLVQIRQTVTPERLFNADYPYFSSFSDTWLEHSRANVEARIASRGLGKDDLVVELASNDGYLLQYYVEHEIPVLGIDPSRGPAEAAERRGVPTRVEFFTSTLAEALRKEGIRANLIHANNVLAHVADTNDFVAGMGHLLADEGLIVVEVPYVRHLIERCEFDTIYHEHLCYFSVSSLVPLFRRHGLAVRHVERLDMHGGSLRIFVEAGSEVGPGVERMLREEAAVGLTSADFYHDFSARVKWVRSELRNLLESLRLPGYMVGAYGAAAKGAILLNYSQIGPKTLCWVADRNVHKQGRYMPGVDLLIVPPSRVLEDQPDYLLILPWNFKTEIMEQQSEYARRGGRFIIPNPIPRIV